VSVVIATRDRRDELLHTLARLSELPERPPVIVVDNGSTDGGPEAVRAAFPDVTVLALGTNLGAPARNRGVAAATTPYVAFADDDSWWAPGALTRAAEAFDAHPRLAVIAARTLVGPDETLDPVNEEMARSPLPQPGSAGSAGGNGAAAPLPGPPVLGFVACAAVVRRDPFLAAGGFSDVVFFMGEEQMLALDLASAGWHLAYVDDVVAHHHPSSSARAPEARRALIARNDLLTTWMRRPLGVVASRTAAMARAALTDPVQRSALRQAAGRIPRAVRERRAIPAAVERQVRLLGG
jgi:GT2 family glycosyltransferase